MAGEGELEALCAHPEFSGNETCMNLLVDFTESKGKVRPAASFQTLSDEFIEAPNEVTVQCLVLKGTRGSGKTRLIQELKEKKSSGVQLCVARGMSTYEGGAFCSFTGVLRSLLGIPSGMEARKEEATLIAVLKSLHYTSQQITNTIFPVLHFVLKLSWQQRGSTMHLFENTKRFGAPDVLVDLFCRSFASLDPCVSAILVFDDADRMDTQSVITLYRIVCAGIPTIVTATGVGKIESISKIANTVECMPLSKEECALTAKDSGINDSLVASLFHACKGNIFWFHQSMLCSKKVAGTFDPDILLGAENAWQRFLDVRLKGCTEAQLHILYAMSTYRNEMSSADFKKMLGRKHRKKLEESMASLVLHGLLRVVQFEEKEGGQVPCCWAVAHRLLLDVIAESVPGELKNKYHLASAALIEKKHFEDMRSWYSKALHHMDESQSDTGKYQLFVKRCVEGNVIDGLYLEATDVVKKATCLWKTSDLKSLVDIVKGLQNNIAKSHGKIGQTPLPGAPSEYENPSNLDIEVPFYAELRTLIRDLRTKIGENEDGGKVESPRVEPVPLAMKPEEVAAAKASSHAPQENPAQDAGGDGKGGCAVS